MSSVIPILRIFDEGKAKEFYLRFLPFTLDWEHRFEANLPLYMQISFQDCILHLSEHHGDCCPGSAIRIQVDNIEELHRTMISREYPFARPGIETTPWDTLELCVIDPFGNRILFYQEISPDEER
ncbi:VOC family protein [Paenibacillus sp. MSJ-34]|nr:VOC family protein [Paenibacillus sp. MSJ-34]